MHILNSMYFFFLINPSHSPTIQNVFQDSLNIIMSQRPDSSRILLKIQNLRPLSPENQNLHFSKITRCFTLAHDSLGNATVECALREAV